MNTSTVIRGTLPLRRRGSAPEHDPMSATETTKASSPRIPRIARLVALARHIDDLVRSGALGSYAAAARLSHVSRARMSQILALLHLAPDLQEQLLFLQRPARGRAAPVLRQPSTGTSSGGAGADCNVPTGNIAQRCPTPDRPSHSSES